MLDSGGMALLSCHHPDNLREHQVTDLERFFRRLVGNLAAADPARLHRPIPLADVQHDILPYRTSRRALELDTSEDYEMVLLRLCAGEGGLVRTEPEDARARFARELESPHPDLGVLHQFENVLLTLRSEPIARALGPEPGAPSAFAPPAARPVPDIGLPELDETAAPEPDAPAEPAAESVEDEPLGPHCLYCGGGLPAGRTVKFCPHCGQSQTAPTCPRCRAEMDPGWRHCVNCGAAVARD